MGLKKILILSFLQLFLFQTTWAQKELAPVNKDLFSWTENKGQWNPNIFFRCQQNALDLHIGKNYLSYYFFDPNQVSRLNSHGPNKTKPLPSDSVLNIYALTLQFLNSKDSKPLLKSPKTEYANFYQGNNPAHWVNHARISNEVGIQNLYSGIDLWVQTKNNKLKYEYWLEPKADLSSIQLEVQGATEVYVEYGSLFIVTPQGILREDKPYSYQYINNKLVEVSIEFEVKNKVISFKAGENYSPNFPLVIDPEMVFLTYSGSTVDNFGCTATPGENGTLYAGGVSTGPYEIIPNGTYPVTSNAFQLTYGGGGTAEGELLGTFPCDITLSKYSSDGTTLLYATYIGGENNEIPHSLFVDDSANLVVMGNTYSNNFPVTANAYDTSQNGRHDFIITKFHSDGSIYASTYLGGSGNDAINFTFGTTNYFFADSYRGDVITDSLGNILIAGVTQSSDFPTSSGAIKDTLSGFQDGAIFKLSPDLSKLIWSTYLGGSGIDAFYSVDLGKNNEIYLSGGTNSTDFPNTNNHFQANNAGGQADGIIAILDYDGKNVLHATYFGTSEYDQIWSLDIDNEDNIYVVGHSLGTVPVSPGVYSNPNSHQFLACFQPDLKTKNWSTVFGSGKVHIDVTINAFLVDDCKRIYISTWGGETAFNEFNSDTRNSSTLKLATTQDAFQRSTDGSDFYLMLLNKNASSLLYATFIGGDNETSDGDHVDGGTSRFDKKGVVYQSICASCPKNGFPAFSDLKTTPNSYSPLNKSPRCSNAALKFDFRIKEAQFGWVADTCSSVFSFNNQSKNASNFFWQFPDGSISTEENPSKFLPSQYFGQPIYFIIEPGTNCADTAIGSVSLPDSADKLKVPNVFTPNGDGFNDVFRIEGVSGQCDETTIYVYNRWGQLYFQDNVPYFRWNGKDLKGIDAPEGVYYYILSTKKINTGQSQEMHGTISLIR
jgi:gliding motility-associated-like protein